MNKVKLPLLALAATLSLSSIAQQDKTETKEKKETKSKTIVITQDDKSEKMTIVVDGENVTVNGKPVEDYKGSVQVLKNSHVWTPKAVTGVRAMSKVRPGANFYTLGNRAFLGVTTEDGDGGAKITEVSKESAAEKAGLKAGDVITKISEYNVADADDVFAALNKMKPEQKVTISYKRDGKQATAEATLSKPSDSDVYASAGNHFDFDFDRTFSQSFSGDKMQGFTFYRRPKLGLQIQDVEEGSGVKILDVDQDTPAAKAGLQKDDVIVSLNSTEIKGVDDVRKATTELKEGDALKVQYKRGGATQSAEIKFPKKLKKADI